MTFKRSIADALLSVLPVLFNLPTVLIGIVALLMSLQPTWGQSLSPIPDHYAVSAFCVSNKAGTGPHADLGRIQLTLRLDSEKLYSSVIKDKIILCADLRLRGHASVAGTDFVSYLVFYTIKGECREIVAVTVVIGNKPRRVYTWLKCPATSV